MSVIRVGLIQERRKEGRRGGRTRQGRHQARVVPTLWGFFGARRGPSFNNFFSRCQLTRAKAPATLPPAARSTNTSWVVSFRVGKRSSTILDSKAAGKAENCALVRQKASAPRACARAACVWLCVWYVVVMRSKAENATIVASRATAWAMTFGLRPEGSGFHKPQAPHTIHTATGHAYKRFELVQPARSTVQRVWLSRVPFEAKLPSAAAASKGRTGTSTTH